MEMEFYNTSMEENMKDRSKEISHMDKEFKYLRIMINTQESMIMVVVLVKVFSKVQMVYMKEISKMIVSTVMEFSTFETVINMLEIIRTDLEQEKGYTLFNLETVTMDN